MKLKSLALVTAATLSLAAFNASACSTSAWVVDGGGTGVAGTPLAAEPDDAVPVPRYAGRCGLRADAAGDTVSDGSATAETTYRARFYVRASSDGKVVFRARNAAAADMITVTFNAAGISFATTGGAATSAAVTLGRWYAIELNWAAGAPMTATVQGNGASTPLATVTTPAAAAGDRIDSATLGWISGGPAGTVDVDAFESRRTTAIGRLCRGDANGDGNRNSGDQVAMRNEFLLLGLATGNPDTTEDGTVNSGDQINVRNIFLAGQGSCTGFPNI